MPKLNAMRGLESFLKANPSKREQKEIEKETNEKFAKILEERTAALQRKDKTYLTIPRFFDSRLMNKNSELQNLILKESRSRFLQQKSTEILDKEELEKLLVQIKANNSLPDDGNERINYDSFLKIANSVSPKCRGFFSASIFLKFDRDEYGRIDSMSFFSSVVRKVSLLQTRVQISMYDSNGHGFLTDKDLEKFLIDLMPTFTNLAGMNESMKSNYLTIATQKFFFFLDAKKTGRIFIKEILVSAILAELYDLRSEKTNEEFLNNWFSSQNASRIADLFSKLDEDKDGLLSLTELSKFKFGLTDLFLRRALEMISTADKDYKLDFKGFIEFILIIENRKMPQSIHFLFKCVDIFDSGRITSLVINTFFKEVLKLLMLRDPEADKNFHIEDVKDEIFDMTNPKDPQFITLYDLYACGQGDLILNIMIDAKAFFDYDQREIINTADDDTQIDIVLPHHKLLTDVKEDSNILTDDKSDAPARPAANVDKRMKFGKSAEV